MSILRATITLSSQQRLERFCESRTRLLTRAQEVVEQDERVCAAWLFGSLGRGDADELSDIDLFVIVEDRAHEEVVSSRYDFMAQLGEPTLVLEAPQNWPPGGVYNMALYPGAVAPHQVDWYWVKRSAAVIPSETKLLFDRVGLPRQESPTRFEYAPVPERSNEEIISQEVNMFWVMTLISAKYLARKPGLENFFWSARSFQRVAEYVEQPLPRWFSDPLPLDPEDKLKLLRCAVRAMGDLMPLVVARGAYVPTSFPPHAQRYLDLIESILTG